MSVVTIPRQWDRWIFQSCAKHFNARRNDIHLHVEGGPRETGSLDEWFEFRLDGPSYRRTSNGDFRIDVEINIAVLVAEANNAFRIHELTGIVAEAFTYSIPVYRHGPLTSDPENDGSTLGCFTLQPKMGESVEKSFFGKVRPDTALQQATLEGHYRMFLTTRGDCQNG